SPPYTFEKDIAGLEVAVQDAALMSIVNGACHRRNQSGRLALLRLPDPRFPTPDLRQTPAFHQLHAEKVLSFVLADLVNWHDVRMVEAGSGFGFGVEPLDVGPPGEL